MSSVNFVCISIRKHPISEKLFEDFLRTMPDTIYHIKGYIRFTGNPDTLHFQYAYSILSFLLLLH
ncbi:CobW C-terminal domain-containing protein [Bacillus paralicheniformis]|uniref:GTP-binding protein n=1 Tax=Bacillus paralicheniformis TaxID=1648923 RepID=UPI001D03964E|nr:GTP-binding protein [Bacillus paralicheniformis]